MELASKLFKGDRAIWIIFMFLCLISVIEVFSATSTIAYRHDDYWRPIMRHATFLTVGFILVLLLHNIPYRFFSAIILLLPVSVLLLLLTPFIGVRANDAHRWMELFGVQFQPSEFAKLSCVVFVAFLLSKRGKFTETEIYRYILIGVGVTCALIFPENFSTALMLFGACFLMMFVGQVSAWKLIKLIVILAMAASLFASALIIMPDNVLKYMPRAETWKERFTDFNHKNKAEEGSEEYIKNNYQVVQAKIAIANGGLFGKLPGHGQQRDILPQAYSDFIYAIIIEELGFIGGMFVLLLYIMLMVRVGIIARRCEKPFPKFLVLGCGLLIVVQAFANMAVAVNLIPVTGQPLPIISRGGTSTIISCIYIGIILSISRFGANIGNEDDIEEEKDDAKEKNEPEELEGKELYDITSEKLEVTTETDV